MKKIISAAMVCIVVVLFSGCNTVKGVGKDVSAGGRDIQRAANL